jgi:hypothetical protein
VERVSEVGNKASELVTHWVDDQSRVFRGLEGIEEGG